MRSLRKLFLLVIIIANFILPKQVFGGLVEKISDVQIAVEKLTGRGEEHEFSGWVGSLRVDVKEKLIVISEFSNIDGIVVVNGVYRITKMEKYDKNIEFECTDINVLTEGIEWRGKIWLTDADEVKIEMVQKQSSRKWTSLSDYGKRFLKENGIEKLYLGI